MYKLSRYISTPSRLILRMGRPNNGPACVIFLRCDRRYSGEDEYEKYVKKRRRFWSLVGVTVLTVGSIAYAKQDPEFRKLITCNIPYSDDFLTVLYQEEHSIGEWALIQYNSAVISVKQSLFGKEGPPPECPVPEEEMPPPQEINYCTERDHVPEEPEPEPEPVAPGVDVPDTKDFIELAKNLQEYTVESLYSYKNGVDIISAYDTFLMSSIEGYITDLDMTRFDRIRQAQEERDDSVKAAEEVGSYDKQVVEELALRLDGEVAGPPAKVVEWRKRLDKFRADIKAAENELKDRLEASCIADQYWKKVEKARKSYYEGIQALLPGVDVAQRKLNYNSTETDYLLMHTLREVRYLQSELAEVQSLRSHRLNRAIEARENREEIWKKIDDMFRRKKYEVVSELNAKGNNEKAEMEIRMREQRKDQMDAQQEQIQQKLDAKEKEVQAKFDRLVNERVEKERKTFKKELEVVLGQLRAIESGLKARSNAEASARRAQGLWTAGETLLAATKQSSKPVVDIDKELTAVEKAGENDEMVKTVLKGVSTEVREHGVLTETALREKYLAMERTALRVALVDKDGAPLPVYILSWLQSIFLFKRVGDIPQNELDDEPTDYSNMDPYDILQRARYWIERNDISSALKYVNLLQGASKVAAKTWCEAAIKHIEVKQAAEAVKAHAVAASLLYLG